ncbi:MAG: hypothetical protein ACPKPY_08665, partial [Nitrososphaeraceae archaeon]
MKKYYIRKKMILSSSVPNLIVGEERIDKRILPRIEHLQNSTNKQILKEYKFLVDGDKSPNSIRNTMKLVLLFSNFLELRYANNSSSSSSSSFLQVNNKEVILDFLNTKKKSK